MFRKYAVVSHKGDSHILLASFNDKNEAMKFKYNYRESHREKGERVTIRKTEYRGMVYRVIVKYKNSDGQRREYITDWYETPKEAWSDANQFLNHTEYLENECAIAHKEI